MQYGMITKDEVLLLQRNIDKLLVLSEEVDLIRQEILGESNQPVCVAEFSKKFKELNSSEEYQKARKALESFIWNLEEEDLYDLHVAFSIGKLGPDSKNSYIEYLMQLEKAKKLCKNKHYVESKFINIQYHYLKQCLVKGLKYLYAAKRM